MLIAVTGATGFLGRYIVNQLFEQGHTCRCWHRPAGDRDGFVGDVEWLPGQLNDSEATESLVAGADAVVHSGVSWMGSEYSRQGSVADFVSANVTGSVALMEAAKQAGAERFVFISTCAVHDIILDDRPLDEAHPLWSTSHYGAHKAAIEKFVHSYGLSDPSFKICSLRPTGIYGLRRPADKGRWVRVVRNVMDGKHIASKEGGKEVHAADVAKAVALLLTTDADIAGQAYNCYDMYVAEQDVARIAKDIAGSSSEIDTLNHGPKHQIDTSKLQALGMTFGGRPRLEQYVKQLVDALS